MAKKITGSTLATHGFQNVSKCRGIDNQFRFRKGYYYRGNASTDDYGNRIVAKLVELGYTAKLVDSGDHWAAFNGGASTAKNSHIWADIRITNS